MYAYTEPEHMHGSKYMNKHTSENFFGNKAANRLSCAKAQPHAYV